jgi:hypothetical protein
MCCGWKFDWFRSGLLYDPLHVGHAYFFEGGQLEALIEYHGTPQKHFYTIRRFRRGARSNAIGRLTLGEAMVAAENPGLDVT